MAAYYKLRCSVVGHTKDVRAVAATTTPENGILSGSRDVSARVWTSNIDDANFSESTCMRGHSNFVSAVCIAPPDDSYPDGLIFTASNDTTILAYTPSSTQPVYKLTGHTNTVCSLASGKFGTLLSGSWDKTAKVWLKQNCAMTLEGHESAVWAVAVIPERGFMITGSADKTIKLWTAGKLKDTFTGHTDCVRGLTVLSNTEFLSCSNDATIRRWSVMGACLQTYFGHCNYIYAVAVLPNREDFVSCGEDRTLRFWHGGECTQTIAHPSESVWTVCCLQNGDVVTGSSDGVIRVFTCEPSRMATEEEQAMLEEEVSASAIPTQIGDINMDELPGPEALVNPGQRDGQSKMVKEGKVVILYHWDMAGARWVKMGEIVGASGGSQATSGKKLFEGQEYDYVFDVDIEEGKPPLKLPYNITDDPWMAAQKFLDKNHLSQLFLDQVANFIQSNAKGVTIGQSAPAVSDPFTGGGRYVPGAHTNGLDHAAPSDPFTGSSSYKSGDGPSSKAGNKYFPQKEYLTFANANKANIIGKLKEFGNEMETLLNEGAIKKVEDIIDGGALTQEHVDVITQLLQWRSDKIFPVLDVIRLGIRHESINKYFCIKGKELLDDLLQYTGPNQPTPNKLLALRILTNLFNQPSGVELMTSHYTTVLSVLANSVVNPNKNIQISAASVLLNYAVATTHKPDETVMIECLNVAAKFLQTAGLDNEAVFRVLVCIGNLIFVEQVVLATAKSINAKHYIEPLVNVSDAPKVAECAKLITGLL